VDVVDHLALAFGELSNEVSGQRWDILFAFSQRRECDRKDIQAVVQIGAKFAFLDHSPKIVISGSNYPHVNLHGAAASQAFELLFLEDTKKFWLQFEGKISDFV
jgi:hypothetical protein